MTRRGRTIADDTAMTSQATDDIQADIPLAKLRNARQIRPQTPSEEEEADDLHRSDSPESMEELDPETSAQMPSPTSPRSTPSSPSTPPPAKRTRAQTQSHPSPSLPPSRPSSAFAKPSRRRSRHTPSSSSSPPAPDSSLPALPSPSLSTLPPDSFDCHPTLSVLTEYFSHHHTAVTRAAHQEGEALQVLLDQQRRLQLALAALWREKERHKGEALKGKLKAEVLQSSLSRVEEDKAKEVERLKTQLARERKSVKEGEEREKVAESKVSELEKKVKATERRLTISDKKAQKLEEAEQVAQQQMAALRTQLASASQAASMMGGSVAPSSAELETLQLKLSFYEGGPTTLHSLSLSELSALGGSLQGSLERVKEEQERRKECKLCLHDLASVVFLPCEHMISCTKCSDTVVKQDCPVCRVRIERRIQTKTS